MDFLSKYGAIAGTLGVFLAGIVYAVVDLYNVTLTAVQKHDITVICVAVVLGGFVAANLIQEYRHNKTAAKIETNATAIAVNTTKIEGSK